MVYDVVVVGSGFSAIAVTINLLRLFAPGHSIAIVGDDPGFGRGTAYRTEFFLHRLNVPAGRMSVFPDRPDDFLDWLRDRRKATAADDFASRGDYGLYLRDTLAFLLRDRHDRAKVDFIKAKATGCVEQYRVGTVFQLDNAAELVARNVVLCLGVGSAPLPVPRDKIADGVRRRSIENPWRLTWLSHVGETDRVCILGSGLTMIDQILALRARGHRGEIRVLSRRGLVPHPHHSGRVTAIEPALPPSREISALLNALRRQVREGADWRAVMDGLRPKTQALWQELSQMQRARFLRHALAWWNIHRHRISPAVFARFDALVKSGTVQVHAGFVQSLLDGEAGVEVTYRARASSRTTSFETDWIVNCTGMERAGIRHSPLLTEMLHRGMISADPLGLGIAVDANSRVIDASRQPQPHIFAVGALTAGQFWEITAVPDIRLQAKHVAESIGASAMPASA